MVFYKLISYTVSSDYLGVILVGLHLHFHLRVLTLGAVYMDKACFMYRNYVLF